MMYNTLSVFDQLFGYRHPSVYVISDSQLKEFKQQQLEAEIAELNKLIDGHQTSIERLEATKRELTSQRVSLSGEEHKPLPETDQK